MLDGQHTGLKLAPHQQRMLTEQRELAQRAADLTTVLADPDRIKKLAIAPAEVARMRRQLAAMEQYDRALLERIEAWGA